MIKFDQGDRIHCLSQFHKTAEGRFYARMSEWTQAVSTAPGKLDKGIAAIVGTLIYSKLGDLAYKIGLDEYLLKITKDKIAALKAKPQKTAEYQVRADDAKRNAASNIAKAEMAAKADTVAINNATIRAKIEAEKIDGAIVDIVHDEQIKMKGKVQLTLDELSKGERPEINNFRQSRIGVLLMAIEGLALTIKLQDHRDSPRITAEITASVLSLTSMTFDVVYAVTKSVKEISKSPTQVITAYKDLAGINKAVEVTRGGLKLTAGIFSAAAGAVSVWLDGDAATDEVLKDRTNWVLVGIYVTRGIASSLGVGAGLIAAFSYTGPMLWRMAGSTVMRETAFAARVTYALASGAVLADSVALARTIWLIRIARLNLAGLAITGVEIIYRCYIMDDDLENWLQACAFRKDKSEWLNEKPFIDGTKEMEALQKAHKVIPG